MTFHLDLSFKNVWKLFKKLAGYYLLFSVIVWLIPTFITLITALWMPISIVALVHFWMKNKDKTIKITIKNPFK
jgi:hypothetical protein